MSHFDKSSHDADVYLYGYWGTKYAAEHCYALFGEGIGEIFNILSPAYVQGHKL